MNLKQFLVFENHFMSQQNLIVRCIFIFLLKHRYIEFEFFSLFVNEKPPAVQVNVVCPPSLEATCVGIHQPSPTKRVYAALRASHLRGPGVSEMGSGSHKYFQLQCGALCSQPETPLVGHQRSPYISSLPCEALFCIIKMGTHLKCLTYLKLTQIQNYNSGEEI